MLITRLQESVIGAFLLVLAFNFKDYLFQNNQNWLRKAITRFIINIPTAYLVSSSVKTSKDIKNITVGMFILTYFFGTEKLLNMQDDDNNDDENNEDTK